MLLALLGWRMRPRFKYKTVHLRQCLDGNTGWHATLLAELWEPGLCTSVPLQVPLLPTRFWVWYRVQCGLEKGGPPREGTRHPLGGGNNPDEGLLGFRMQGVMMHLHFRCRAWG